MKIIACRVLSALIVPRIQEPYRTAARCGRHLIVAAALVLPGLPAAAGSGGLDGVSICHGFGCRFKESISITEHEWNEIKAFFKKPAATAAEEREQIKKASGWFEVIAGRYTPINRDKGKNGRIEADSVQAGTSKYAGTTIGQMDCIDESLNMTTFLALMEEAGLFEHHRVVERAHRQSAFDQHYAAQIEELETGARWVVDSWFYDYGSLPYVEEAGEWHDIPFLFGTSFHSE